jgi:hypothetical protein
MARTFRSEISDNFLIRGVLLRRRSICLVATEMPIRTAPTRRYNSDSGHRVLSGVVTTRSIGAGRALDRSAPLGGGRGYSEALVVLSPGDWANSRAVDKQPRIAAAKIQIKTDTFHFIDGLQRICA